MSIIKNLLSLPKIIYINFMVFPMAIAIKMPIWVHYRVRIANIHKGCIQIENQNCRCGMIKLGCSMGSAGVFDGEYPLHSGGGYIDIKPECTLRFKGSATIAGGFSIRIDKSGEIEFGKNFTCNSFCFFAANDKIKFGDNCTLGWRVNVRDVDGHDIFSIDDFNKKAVNGPREVIVGDHVWVAACVDILKGTRILNDSVIAYGTLLTGQQYGESNIIIGGSPAKVLKKSINWRF